MKINNLHTIQSTGKVDNQFVGIKISHNQIEFHYPETYCLSDNDDELRKDLLAVLRTVSLAKTQTRDMSSYYSEHSLTNDFPLGAYLWIINDYLTYGRYENREKKYVRGNSGRINWKRTMRSNPVISEGSIIYTDIISEKRSQEDNILTEIYFFCVQKSIDSIGWLYGIVFDPEGIDYYRLFNKKYYLGVLNTEISHTFDDQKRTRLINMRNIITGLDDELVNTREIVYGVDSYDYVYEKMIDSFFSNVDNIKEFYPNAYWELAIEDKPVKSTNLRPDTVLIDKENKKVYILDAKYYRYGTTFEPKDMPDTTSIQKQITYGEYVKAVKDGVYNDVYSAFIMPYSQSKNKYTDRFHEKMEFVGVGHAAWIKDEAENNRKIVAVLIDTKYLIKNYLRKNDSDTEALISIIEKALS